MPIDVRPEPTPNPNAIRFALSSALLTFIVVAFSILLLAVQVAGGQLSPRIIARVFERPITKAVLSAFVFHYLAHSVDAGPVAERAAKRIERRDGRSVRIPREPDPAVDQDVEGAAGPTA